MGEGLKNARAELGEWERELRGEGGGGDGHGEKI